MGRVYLNEGWKFTENFSVNLFYPGIGDNDMVNAVYPQECV